MAEPAKSLPCRQACQALGPGLPGLARTCARPGGFTGKVPDQAPPPDLFSYGLFKGAASQYLNLRPPSKASPAPKLFEGFLGSRRVFAGGSISASCAEHPSIFSSTFSIFEAFCVARPHASWPDPAPISIPHGTFSAIFEDHDDACPAQATAVPTPHIANGGEKLISTATEPVFAYPIKVARNSPTKPSAFHYASWFGHSVFSGPVVSSGNFVCSESFGRNMKI